jgi:amidohydrolase
MSLQQLKKEIENFIEVRLSDYQDLALAIHNKPEVSNYEFFACEVLTNILKEEGFKVDIDVAGHRTGFAAYYKSNKPGPTLAFLAEYDALVGLGHGCGHNLFGATSALAGAAIKKVIDQIGGEVIVYGTPGEEGGENGSAKESFVVEGFFKNVDAALCVHSATIHAATPSSLANDPVDIEFWGQASHASGQPENGINALDAILQVYNSLNALRQHLTDDVRIHGIITHGGDAPNTVPDYASARFYLRGATRPTVDALFEKTNNIVKGAALATGAKGKITKFQNKVDNTIPTPSFDAVYKKHLESYGETFAPVKNVSMGSTDVGNVSQVIPTIQPYISISDENINAHSIEFRDASCSQKGLDSIGLGAKVLALTALDLYLDSTLLETIKEEHKNLVKAQTK